MQQEEDKGILPGYTNVEQFTKDGYKILMEAIRNSNSLPSGRDWSYFSTFETFNNTLAEDGNNILKLINTVLKNNQVQGNIRNRGLEEKTELIIEANDIILEKVANNIDEMNGIKKTVNEPVLIQTVSAELPINGAWNRINNATFSVNSSITAKKSARSAKSIHLLTAKNIVRPQNFFKDKVVNKSKNPWEPRIKEKPNNLKPLALLIEETENGEEFCHPYEFELDRFKPLPKQLVKETPVPPLPTEKTPLIEVNEPEQINALVETLRGCEEFAVDVEHHSYRTFMGITCLLQISTKSKDYIIDTLALRNDLHKLNEVFTKPSIVKILHGADMDVKWLQRHLSLYVVNMFDTYQAARVLECSTLSLASLIQRYCNFVPDKQFQLADWRIRPLPDELKAYAREDTHYLIYIYQMMKNELLRKANGQDNLLVSVINKSTEICKKRYFRPVLREDSHLDFYRKCKRLFDNRQLYALKELYSWRDEISRQEDESTGYVLPNHMLLQISERLPREMQGILACCNPIPPLVRSNLLELHKMVLKAREQPLERAIFKEDTRARGTTTKISKVNVDSPLHCPHDLTKSNDFRDDLSVLVGSTTDLRRIVYEKLVVERERSSHSVFGDVPEKIEISAEIRQKLHSALLGPFERYKMVKPFIQEEERKLEAEKLRQEEEAAKKTAENQDAQKAAVEGLSDQERIEGIRDYFLRLSRQAVPTPSFIDVPDLDESLIDRRVLRKRKREGSVPDASDGSLNTASTDTPENNLNTTIPNIQRGGNNPRKRKSSDLEGWERGKERRADFRNQGQVVIGENRSKKAKWPKKKKQKKPDNPNKSGGGPEQSPEFGNQGNENQPFSSKKRKRKKKNNKAGQKQQQQQAQPGPTQNNQNFTPYDYSSVNYNEFQGGAPRAQKPATFRSKFKAKGKKNKGNAGNNQSSTFHPGTNRGRGRGRRGA